MSPVDVEPVALESARDEPMARYINKRHGFAIAVPGGWDEFAAASNEDGSIFENKALGADLRIFASANEGDVDYQQAVEALRDGTRDIAGGPVSENEYRGSAIDTEGDRIQMRLVRKPGGALVTALMRYPVTNAAELDPVAAVTLDSLRLEP